MICSLKEGRNYFFLLPSLIFLLYQHGSNSCLPCLVIVAVTSSETPSIVPCSRLISPKFLFSPSMPCFPYCQSLLCLAIVFVANPERPSIFSLFHCFWCFSVLQYSYQDALSNLSGPLPPHTQAGRSTPTCRYWFLFVNWGNFPFSLIGFWTQDPLLTELVL